MRSILMRYPQGKPKAVTFSYDDGVIQDKRLSEIFNKYGLKATFNLNCDEMRTENFTGEQIKECFLSKGHEIAIHGAMHRATGNLRSIEGIREVLDCRLELEKKCDCIIRGMAYPDTGITIMSNFGSYDMIKHYLIELDIAYSRTLGEDNNSFMLPADFYAWMPTAHHNNPKVMEYIDEFLGIDVSTNIYYPKPVTCECPCGNELDRCRGQKKGEQVRAAVCRNQGCKAEGDCREPQTGLNPTLSFT